MAPTIRTKRAYDAPAKSDGVRILVDRLWPRGISKENACIDHWIKSIAPSDGLRKWYHAHMDAWEEFQRRYVAELDDNPEGVDELRAAMTGKVATFVYSSKEETHNNATALKTYLERK